VSANFGFLKPHGEQLYRLAALAEHYFQGDANTCLFKLRQFPTQSAAENPVTARQTT
jgi:type I restriction enzyme, R subunit